MLYSEINAEIKNSKKYAFLCDDVIERICMEEFPKYKKKQELIKVIKTKLHLLYGAYFNNKSNENASVILDKYEKIDNIESMKICANQIMNLHSSTMERLPYISEFYRIIFETVGKIETILDIGCGFNPFSFPYILDYCNIKEYYASDIDSRTAIVINKFFRAVNLTENASVFDVVSKTPMQKVDITFLFKLLPVLEQQSKGRCFSLLNELNSEYIIVTYPLKSLGGRFKNMEANYSQIFENNIDREIFSFKREKTENELIYIVSRIL